MSRRFPNKITRRLFLGTSGKIALGAVGIVAGLTSFLYYGAIRQQGGIPSKKEDNLIELGDLNQFKVINGVNRIGYNTTIGDGISKKNVKGFIYVTSNADRDLSIMSSVCSHLGCDVLPAPETERRMTDGLFFRCPCHGAEFDFKGNAIGGVVLVGLETFQPIIAGGKLLIDILSPIKGTTANTSNK
ncbi:QcrA and Rieske domain-containing protein [Paenibacillus pini]|uniref:Menaquinol-cytochrome c reductase n=1 Tax=Paenibacillus pini JCM 16418 TaxID=1236976 RepID=W7YI85_9BACL|nr:Rieske (2Fe-2S) protein [Paenibacillus pini]GAF08162.1 menaquinol-cytochrome c reductase [Paenibacillus pini JCM 16418]